MTFFYSLGRFYSLVFKFLTFFSFSIISSFLFQNESKAELRTGAPIFLSLLGVNNLNFNMGTIYTNQNLGSSFSFNPTILWNYPTFRSRLGIHYIGEFMSPYSLLPISGVGLSGYYYPFGLSSMYEISPDEILFQKSTPGPFVFIKITPVNFNLNVSQESSPFGSSISSAAFMIEISLGAGFDYPLKSNMTLSGDIHYRLASAQERVTKQTISYSGLGIVFGFSTSYH